MGRWGDGECWWVREWSSELGARIFCGAMSDSIAPLFRGWELLQAELTGFVERSSAEELGWRASPGQWPIWASIGHLAGCRVYWLCHVFKEPGAETTPFATYGDDPGWEDDLSHPRDAGELLGALESSWAIVSGVLQRWTPAMLDEEFIRTRSDGSGRRTRGSPCSFGC